MQVLIGNGHRPDLTLDERLQILSCVAFAQPTPPPLSYCRYCWKWSGGATSASATSARCARATYRRMRKGLEVDVEMRVWKRRAAATG